MARCVRTETFGHEAEHGEHDEAGEHGCAAVDEAHQDGVPAAGHAQTVRHSGRPDSKHRTEQSLPDMADLSKDGSIVAPWEWPN